MTGPSSKLGALSALLLLSLTACTIGGPAPAPTQAAAIAPTPIPTRSVDTRTTIAADGTVALAVPAVSLSIEAAGARINAVKVMPGQVVRKGDVLATVDDTALQDALTDAKTQLALVEAQIRQTAAPASAEDIAAARAALAAAQSNYAVIKKGATAADVEQARLSWETAKSQYQSAQATRDLACGPSKSSINCKTQEASLGNSYESERSAYERYQALLQPQTADKIAQAYAAIASAQARLATLTGDASEQQKKLAEAQYQQQKSAVERAQANLAKATLRSPCDCVVQEVAAVVGNLAGGPAVTLVSLSGLQFKTTNLTERDVARIGAGARASVRVKAFDAPIPATVQAVLAQSTGTQSGAAVFTVILTLGPSENTLLPGMTGQAEITLGT